VREVVSLLELLPVEVVENLQRLVRYAARGSRRS
jgi:hypothetical protein